MIRRIRDFLTLGIFLGLVAVSIAAGVAAARQGLPEPEVTDPVKRLQRLAEHDIRQQPDEVKLRLAHRLEEDFARNIDWQPELEQFDDTEWARFQANFEELMRVWLLHKVNTWANLPIEQQGYYIEEQFDYLMTWRPPERNRAPATNGGRRRRGALNPLALEQRLKRYLDSETPEQRARIDAFGRAVLQHAILHRTLPGPFGGNLE